MVEIVSVKDMKRKEPPYGFFKWNDTVHKIYFDGVMFGGFMVASGFNVWLGKYWACFFCIVIALGFLPIRRKQK